jgi:hypothetical protein
MLSRSPGREPVPRGVESDLFCLNTKHHGCEPVDDGPVHAVHAVRSYTLSTTRITTARRKPSPREAYCADTALGHRTRTMRSRRGSGLSCKRSAQRVYRDRQSSSLGTQMSSSQCMNLGKSSQGMPQRSRLAGDQSRRPRTRSAKLGRARSDRVCALLC